MARLILYKLLSGRQSKNFQKMKTCCRTRVSDEAADAPYFKSWSRRCHVKETIHPKNENSVLIYLHPYWWKVVWSFFVHNTFLELQSKTFQRSAKQLKKPVTCFGRTQTEIFTVATKLRALACDPSEAGAQARTCIVWRDQREVAISACFGVHTSDTTESGTCSCVPARAPTSDKVHASAFSLAATV